MRYKIEEVSVIKGAPRTYFVYEKKGFKRWRRIGVFADKKQATDCILEAADNFPRVHDVKYYDRDGDYDHSRNHIL